MLFKTILKYETTAFSIISNCIDQHQPTSDIPKQRFKRLDKFIKIVLKDVNSSDP